MLSLMDTPECVERLSEVDNIGRTRAANIKQLWDASRGKSHAPAPHLHCNGRPVVTVLFGLVLPGIDIVVYAVSQCFLISAIVLTMYWLHAELREMRQFVKTLGLTGRLAQMLVERHGKYTEARLKQDPYSCLHGMPGVTFRYAGLPLNFPARFFCSSGSPIRYLNAHK